MVTLTGTIVGLFPFSLISVTLPTDRRKVVHVCLACLIELDGHSVVNGSTVRLTTVLTDIVITI